MCKVTREDADNEITFMNQKYLDAMRVWVQEKEMFNIDICVADFNIAVEKEYVGKMHEKEEIGKDADRDATKKPDEFEGKDWNRFHKAIDAYLSLLKGVTGFLAASLSAPLPISSFFHIFAMYSFATAILKSATQMSMLNISFSCTQTLMASRYFWFMKVISLSASSLMTLHKVLMS